MRARGIVVSLALAAAACSGGDPAPRLAAPTTPTSTARAEAKPVSATSVDALPEPPAPAVEPPVWSLPRRPGIALGSGHGCRLDDVGVVRCWGQNRDGQLGRSERGAFGDPDVVPGLPAAQRLDAGSHGSCIISDAGELVCWGSSFDQAPVKLAFDERVIDLSYDGYRICVRLEGGKLSCFRDYNHRDPEARKAVALPAGPLTSGADHTCTVSEGKVWCIGQNDHGQLGLGRGRERVVEAEPALGIDAVVEAFAADDATCAIGRAGEVWCWGKLPNGEWESPHPVAVPPARSLAMSESHLCVVTRVGEVWCWGRNRYGQLGDGSDEERSVPVQARGLSGVDTVAVGESFSCAARREGGVWCWGSNADHRLAAQERRDSTTPVRIAGISGARGIAARVLGACAVLGDGSMSCWGSNREGLFDDDSFDDQLAPTRAVHLRDMQSVSMSHRHGCGVDTNKAAWCWGRPDERLGVGLQRKRAQRMTRRQALNLMLQAQRAQQDPDARKKLLQGRIDAQRPRRLTTLSDVEELETTGLGGCARDGSARVWCWGFRSGDGTRVVRSRPVRVPQLGPVVDLAAGTGFACGVERDGKVQCWGENFSGQLGDGTTDTRFAPVRVAGVDVATQVSAGGTHTCVRLRDGHVLCWGSNDRGQLGRSTTSKMESTPSAVAGIDDVAMVAAGLDHTCALDRGGHVWCWGLNNFGQLGVGHLQDLTTPAQVSGLDEVTAIDSGDELTCALRRDGSVWCWGAFLPPLRGAWSPVRTSI